MQIALKQFEAPKVSIIVMVLFGVFWGTLALSDEVIDDFEGTFAWTAFGGAAPTVEQTSDFANGGSSSMRIITDDPFNDGFGVGATRTISPALSADGFSSISYWFRSSDDDSDRTVAIQLTDGSDNVLAQTSSTQLTLADAFNIWVQVNVPLERNTAFEGPIDFDFTNIAKIDIVLRRNGLSTEVRTIVVDDIEFIDQPSKPLITGLVDDFSPPAQYNSTNFNDIGGFTDEDGIMGAGNTNDRVVEDGLLSLTWDNTDNDPDISPFDFWFSVFNDNGADISQNSHIQLRMKGMTGSEQITAVLRNSGEFTSELMIPDTAIQADLTTINLALNDFTPTPTLRSMKSLTLTFPDTPTGNVEIDQIVLSPHRRADSIQVAAMSPTTFENGQTIQLEIGLLDEEGEALDDFTSSISLEVTNGVISPSNVDGFDTNGGSVTLDFTVSATTGSQTITVKDSVVNVSSELAIVLSETTNQEVDHFDVEVPTDPVQFWGTIFPITVTAKNSNDLAVGNNVGLVDITSDEGSLILLDSDGEEVSSINMTQNPSTILAFLKDPPDEDLSSVTLQVELIADRTKNGSATANFKNAASTDGEIEVLTQQQDDSPTDLVRTDVSGDAAHIYTNALAIISFVHKAVLDDEPDTSFEERAKRILSVFEDIQISSGDNNGGFFDAYDLSDLDIEGNPNNAVNDVTTGNNAWLLMAINYYAIYTDDGSFLNMAVELGKFLQRRQATTNATETPSFDDTGGVFSRDSDRFTFVTEHQAEAYSGLFYLAQLDGVSDTDATGFSTSAESVRLFLMRTLLDSGRFDVAAGRPDNTSTDAQTAPFLGLVGPTVNNGMEDIDISTALDFVFTNIFKSQPYDLPTVAGNPTAIITGPTFRELDPNPDCGAEQFVWIEGAGQLALALGVLIDSGEGSSDDVENRDLLLENMRKVRDSSGGFPTHLGEQLDCVNLDNGDIDDDTELVGNDDISVVAAAWSYFNKVDPILNPYAPNPVLFVEQDKVFIPGDGASQVTIMATLRQAASVANQPIEFDFEAGNGTLACEGALPGVTAPTSLNCSTDASGVATAVYTAGSTGDIANITVDIIE